jgi:hypothetical protein
MVCSCKNRADFLGVVEAAGIGCCHYLFSVDSISSFVGHVRARATCLWAQVASVNSLVKRFQCDDALIDAHAGVEDGCDLGSRHQFAVPAEEKAIEGSLAGGSAGLAD